MDFKHTIKMELSRFEDQVFEEICLLQQKENPFILCLQETFLKPEDKISLKGFNLYHYAHLDCQRPSGSSSIFVKSSCPQKKFNLNTELQAVAVSVTLDQEITNCFVYIPPSFFLKIEQLDSLLKQLPSPYLPSGDLNGHNIPWCN